MPKVSIITRARNRLEYTIRCVDAVIRCTDKEDYEHLVINQLSSDGTRQWLDWIGRYGGEWFSHVRAIDLDRNAGDWGGMLIGIEYAKGQYVVQLDNDIVVSPGWLGTLLEVLDGTEYGTVQPNRKGSGLNALPVDGSTEFVRPDGTVLQLGRRKVATGCYLCAAQDVRDARSRQPPRNCRMLTRNVAGGACMIMDLYVEELDGSDTESDRSRFLQQRKYPRTSPQIWETL
ncbi:hypothetical protein LCGC14_0939990 [marine sediment metagenome]|uniref:Glycosyltransferase 2-like domain-containing protein n=1 Tax=marine sediment metagenome TaxID=412755 RepID=A0A0F9R3Z9_9ZZZZ